MEELSWAFKNCMRGKDIITDNIKVGFNIFTLHKKGDLSNFIKLVEDAGNKIVWKDDAQIKAYSESFVYLGCSKPFLILTIEKLKG